MLLIPTTNVEEAINYVVPFHVSGGILVHVVDMSYFRERDTKRFVRREILVTEGGKVMTHVQFKRHRFYAKIMGSIDWLDSLQGKPIH